MRPSGHHSFSLSTVVMTGLCLLPTFLCVVPDARADARFHLAAGADLGFQNRNEYGAASFSRYDPELVVHGYFGGLMGDVWLRSSLRLAYLSEQPEMPKSLRVEERDFRYTGELGVLYEWYVVPSFSVGGGAISRRIKLVTKEPISGSADIDTSETLPLVFVQSGIGVPLWKGFVVAEPFYRHSWVKQDARITYTYGLEITVQIF